MTAPAERTSARVSALPAPELVTLEGDSGEAWWTEYGGTLDRASGVIAFPPQSLPQCRFSFSLCRGTA